MNQNASAENNGMAGGDSGGPVFCHAPDGGLVVAALNTKTDVQRVSQFKAYHTDLAESLEFIRFIIDLVDSGAL